MNSSVVVTVKIQEHLTFNKSFDKDLWYKVSVLIIFESLW